MFGVYLVVKVLGKEQIWPVKRAIDATFLAYMIRAHSAVRYSFRFLYLFHFPQTPTSPNSGLYSGTNKELKRQWRIVNAHI